MPVTITTRTAKGSALSHSEMDANLTNLKTSADISETNVTALQTSVGTAQSNITTLQSGLSGANTNISTLQTQVAKGSQKTITLTASGPLGTENCVLVDASLNSLVLVLPIAAANLDKWYTIKRIDSILTNTVTIDANASETIDGVLTVSLNTQWQTIRIISNGVNWFIV